MKYCTKCRVDVTGNCENCPLCQRKLSGVVGESHSAFPYIPTIKRQFGMLFKLIIFIGVACGVLCLTINLSIPQTGWWSLAVLSGIGCFFVSLSFAINKWSNPTKNTIYQVIIVSAISVVWDYFTGFRGWSLDFVIPIISVSAMVTMTIISRVTKAQIDDYILYWIIAILIGNVPIIFLFTGLIDVLFPSLICITISLILLAALVIFEGKRLLAEFKRRFHV